MGRKINISNIDMLRAMYYVHIRNKFLWGLCVFPGSILYMVSFVGLWAMGFPLGETLIISVEMLAWILILNMFGYLVSCAGLLLNPRWRKGRVGEHLVHLNEEGFVEETDFNKTEIKWSSVKNIVESRGLLFFPFGGGDIFVVPKRSFSSTNEWDDFVTSARSNWDNNRYTR